MQSAAIATDTIEHMGPVLLLHRAGCWCLGTAGTGSASAVAAAGSWAETGPGAGEADSGAAGGLASGCWEGARRLRRRLVELRPVRNQSTGSAATMPETVPVLFPGTSSWPAAASSTH